MRKLLIILLCLPILFILLLIGLQLVTQDVAKPTNWQEFNQQMLQEGKVEEVVIVNKQKVYVHIKKKFLSDEEFKEVSKKAFGNAPNYGPHYYFEIGSVETFHNVLKEAQSSFDYDDKIITLYETRKKIFSNIPDFISWFLLYFLCFIMLFSWVEIYRKSNNPGWSAIIPIYNVLIYLKIIGKPWYWIFLFCIPLINVVFHIWGCNLLSKKFGKKEDFTFGLVFLPFIFLPILGFGNSVYIDESRKTKNSL